MKITRRILRSKKLENRQYKKKKKKGKKAQSLFQQFSLKNPYRKFFIHFYIMKFSIYSITLFNTRDFYRFGGAIHAEMQNAVGGHGAQW